MTDLEHDATVRTAQDLIRIDTTNWGNGRARGEREAAEYLEERLTALGSRVHVFEAAPRRTSIVARIPGRNPELPALVVHGHTDVVPADADDWQVDPFAGEIRDGMLWGRGAVDMKNVDAMMITALEQLQASGEQPARDLIVAFFADEEDGGKLGAHWLVEQHPELFTGATQAISEVGGYSINVDGRRAYLLQTGEKGMIWARLQVRRRPGHGSKHIHRDDNAIQVLAAAIVRLAEHEWPMHLGDTSREMVAALCELTGEDAERIGADQLALRCGSAAAWLTASLRTTANPTVLEAGSKQNVVPATATVTLDIRPLPGDEDAVLEKLQQIVGDDVEITLDWRFNGAEAPSKSDLVTAATRALRRFDPDALVVPYLLPAGTDNKSLARLGIDGYGFAPLLLPETLDFPALFHGIDERVPLGSLVFGREVLAAFLRDFDSSPL
ncbi:M20/M25/M40 family metallo-hydrolase [uncultured Gulosibacter sp.]|uniref:M20/M25/M40 family metallo-hydrolase n=1 Tax=uncultured Gulosibacter sp. TaxID=1339167 RepID=UPI00288A8514|nr:M20/M25/M40 family metallo-hydrolase [uncultured Gulosibacter sp.]